MYAVLGATGRTGRIAVETLRSWGLPTRAIVRDASKAADLAARGAEVAIATFDEPEALAASLEGVQGLYFLVVPDVTSADPVASGIARGRRVVEAAAAAGVGHVVLLSSVGAQQPAGTGPIVILHHVEQALRASGIPSTFLRAAYFLENWAQVVGVARAQGVLPTFLAPTTPVPSVDTRDIGRTAARLLAEGPTGTRIVELTGPTDPTPADVAATLAEVLHSEVAVAAAPPTAAADALVAAGLPAPVAAMYAEMYRGIDEGVVAFEGTPVRGRVPVRDSLAEVARL